MKPQKALEGFQEKDFFDAFERWQRIKNRWVYTQKELVQRE